MLLPSAAVLLLSALQPALGRRMDPTKNGLGGQRQTATDIAIDYFAPNPPCGPERPWAAIWPADAPIRRAEDVKAWSWVEPTNGRDIRSVRFNLDKLDAGEYKAFFACNGRQPWLVSEPFKVVADLPARQEGERCEEATDCADGLFCQGPCGVAIDHGGPMCLSALKPTCERVPAKKQQGERCDKGDDCGEGLRCQVQVQHVDGPWRFSFQAGRPACVPVESK